jgi:hypothetical protein
VKLGLHLRVVGLVAVAIPLSGVASAEPVYLPLSVGDTWTYEEDGGMGETMTVTGLLDLLGNTVHVIQYSESTNNDSLENYWTREGDGDVLLWGFLRHDEGASGYAYLPPIRLIDAPVFVGKTWRCTSAVYELPSESPLAEPLVIDIEVTWEGDLEVPAGTFSSISVSDFPPSSSPERGHRLTLDGRSRSTRPPAVGGEYWYSDGVGQVQYDSGGLYKLISFGITPVEAATWGRIKVLYR